MNSNPFNLEFTINLIDLNNNFIQMINQQQASRMLRNGSCELIAVKPATIRYKLEKWDNKFLVKTPKWYLKKFNLDNNSLKNGLYGNWTIQSPEGIEMFKCDSKRALWYLNRNAVDIVNENTLKFNFKPKGVGHIGDHEYYLTSKENCCVVCGNINKLTKHHVVPYVFRKHLPEIIKKNNCYDILLMCKNCHKKYETEAQKLKMQICEEFNISVYDVGKVLLRDKAEVITVSKTLISYGKKIPNDRKEILLNKIRKYLCKQEINDEDLQKLSKLNRWKEAEDIKHYSKQIIENIKDVEKFIKRWREHFVNIMEPKFLPKLWETEHRITRRVL